MRPIRQASRRLVVVIVNLICWPALVNAQAFQGYTLFSPSNSRNSYLSDMNNNVVHTWTHNRGGGYSYYLL
jgi:hypothetical protein